MSSAIDLPRTVGGCPGGPTPTTRGVAALRPHPTAAPARPGGGRFMLGAWPDFVLLGPGFTLAVTALLGALAAAGRLGVATTVAFALTLMFVGPHYAATYRRAFASRAILRAHPFVTMGAPALLFAAAAAAVRWPGTAGLAFFPPTSPGPAITTRASRWAWRCCTRCARGRASAPPEKRLVAFPLYLSWIVSLTGLFRVGAPARNPAYELTRAALARRRCPRGCRPPARW